MAPFLLLSLCSILARPSHAATQGTISVDEGASFTKSQTITVHYKGFGLYERFFVQQCWEGPSPAFDYSTKCTGESMVYPGLLDKDEGSLKFQLFVGDDPYGDFPVSCGPKSNPSNIQYDTCYIRAVTYDRGSNDRAVFFPITFTASGSASVPPAGAGANSAAATTVASGSAAATTAATPKLTVTVNRGTTQRVLWRDLAGIGVGLAVGAGAFVLVSNRRRRNVASRA